MYISAWKAHTDGIRKVIEDALEVGLVDENDTVWQGPTGDYVVGTEADDPEYADYSDAGTVYEYV